MSHTRRRLIVDLPIGLCAVRRQLHVERGARDRYGFPADAFTVGGRLLEVDFDEAERITAAMNAARVAGAIPGPSVSPGELGAAALLHELAHALLSAFDWQAAALVSVRSRLGTPATARLLAVVRERFPPPTEPGSEPPTLQAESGNEGEQATLEELLLLGEARDNRALDALAELFELADLTAGGDLDAALTNVHDVLRDVVVGSDPNAMGGDDADDAHPHDDGGRLRAGGGRVDLLTMLRAPAVRHPHSLLEQLEAALSLWAPLLGERFAVLLRRALRSLDQLREERTFVAGPGPAGPGGFPEIGPTPEHLGEAVYSRDRDWMPRVVMVAKNAFVWLEQLSRRCGQRIERLDQVPDEELRALADFGFDTLWLVGIWQRSEASRAIKRLRGQPFAEASAYAIFDYVIAPELGGEAALAELAARATRQGLRLASDMVPNHSGIDARWVEEHPDWFLRLDAPPFEGYRFAGPDLTVGRAIEVRIEDGYYDGSDAAVVFQRRDRGTGSVSYVYHGNDGTAMPWNDTAQLDYLNPAVRAAVIETIVAVAQRFKVIRFDAAMTLVKRHIRRLWHPPPGEGGAVPSRSRHALEAVEFDRAMPREFWREVVEAVSARAPDTLLVAEAFWLLESYFVRTLGVHRVYNSAFMHLLGAERNADHRRLLRRTLAHDARDLERFVNYLTTPDEESAAETFGTGDKYFGAATMLATLPGMPLFGHGQVEGLSEKYGMEFRAPRLDETPDDRLVERHRLLIAPLLARRGDFASADGFKLLDLVDDDGNVIDDVYAYLFARTADRERAALVLFNNSPLTLTGQLAPGWPGSGGPVALDLAATLGLVADQPNRWLHARMRWSAGGAPRVEVDHDGGEDDGEDRGEDRGERVGGDEADNQGIGREMVGGQTDGGEATRAERGVAWDDASLRERGLRVTLEPYQAVVFLDFVHAAVGRQRDHSGTAREPAEQPLHRSATWTPAMLTRRARDANRGRAAARRRR